MVRYGQDTGLLCVSYVAASRWFLGFPAQAQQWIARALARARQHLHPLSRLVVLVMAASLARCQRDWPATQAYAETASALAETHGFPLWAALGMSLQGRALVGQGQHCQGLALLHQGLARCQNTWRLIVPYALLLLAEGYLHSGDAAAGLRTVAEMRAVARNPDHFHHAERDRLQGELLLQRNGVSALTRAACHLPDTGEAEACLHQALAFARRGGAKALELRAALSLARLWQRQGKPQAARQLLAEVYGWFTEGFDTADLCEARELLEALGGMP